MKKITMFSIESCPHCKRALRWMDVLFAENPDYKALEIEQIDELKHPEISDRYEYDLVPAYYIGEEKLHEGVAGLEEIRRVFDAAMERS
jgi:glutaredoxin